MDRSEFSKGISTFFLLLIISAGLLLLDNFGVLVKPRAFTTNFIIPAQRGLLVAGQGVTGFFSFLTFWKSGSSKISYLEQRVRELTVDSEKVKRLEIENESLRAQLGVPVSKKNKLLMASVVGTSSKFLIDKGSRDGIREGMGVIARDIFVGKVQKVTENSSVVLTLTDPSSKVTAQTSKTKAKGIIVGQFGVGASMEKVVSEDTLVMDDVVMTTGEDGITKGLMIGKLSEIIKDDAGVFQRAKVTLLIDYSKISEVFVILE